MVDWATDFQVSDMQECSGSVTLSINRVGETPDISSNRIILTCDDPDTLAVEIYAWDNSFNPKSVQPDGLAAGPNYDHCLTYVVVQDNLFDLCGDPAKVSVAGLIETSGGDPVEHVDVRLTGSMESTLATKDEGGLLFQ